MDGPIKPGSDSSACERSRSKAGFGNFFTRAFGGITL